MIYNYYKDKHWMQHALTLANIAESQGEIPVGVVLILKNNIIAEGWNCSIRNNDPTAHAEIIALRNGGSYLCNYRLLDSIMYVTLEPCMMCLGAIISARIKRLVFGAYSKKFSITKLIYALNSKIILTPGILEKDCVSQLNKFFHRLRTKK